MPDRAITVTEAAAAQIRRVLEQQSWGPDHGLRFGLKDGGCSGYTYQIDFEAAPAQDDIIHEEHGIKVFISPLHLPFVDGTVLDWKRGSFEEGFDIQNPQAKRHCGCGESFDV
jgi:iron-sulfur cluster assembly protein